VDALGSAAHQTLTIAAMAAANRTPVATSATIAAPEETATTITLSATDADGDALVYALATLPQHGTLTGTAPQFVYTGAPNFFGSDGFTFTVTDSLGASSTGTIAVAVSNVNDAPTAASQTVGVAQNTPVTLTLAAQDVDGDSLSWSVGQPQHGVLSGTAPQLTYTPTAGFSGSDAFPFSVSDGMATATATVSISVISAPLNITTVTLPNGKSGPQYNTTITATGGSTPYRWSIVSGQLPGGLVLNAVTGVLSGKPAAGTFTFTVRVTDAVGAVDDQPLTLTVNTVGKK
jgi:hypothetical protein